MVCQYSHQNQEHAQNALTKLDSRIVTKTSDQTGTQDQAKATIDERDYTGITHRRRATNVAQRKSLKNEWARLDSNQRPKDYEADAQLGKVF